MILGEGSCISCDLATHMMIWPTWSKSMREINQDWTRDISTLLLKFWSNFCSIATRQWPEFWNLYIDFKIAFQVRRVHRCGQFGNQNFDLKKVKIKTWKLNFKFQVRRGDGYIDVGGVYDSPAAQAYWATRLVHQHYQHIEFQTISISMSNGPLFMLIIFPGLGLAFSQISGHCRSLFVLSKDLVIITSIIFYHFRIKFTLAIKSW